MKNLRNIVLTIVAAMIMPASCKQNEPTDLAKTSIIPKPVSVTATGEAFSIDTKTAIFVDAGSDELLRLGRYLADRLNVTTGFEIAVQESKAETGRGSILLTLSGAEQNLGEEGYILNVTRQQVTLSAAKPAGLFRGIQTIRQIAEKDTSSGKHATFRIPAGTITDYPEYSYRGMMLDVSRHFFGVEDVKKVIEYLAFYKINTLHLHLSDDQGWRIEIKSWPNLTAHGGSTQVGGGRGGFYTQEQYSDIVKYAADHYITIVPEIDMPGHTNAALASYPELNCDGKAPELYTGTEVGFSSLCTKKEITYKFIDDVVREISSLTPGPFFHIGGDESHATKPGDYIPFINRVQDIVEKYGKRVIGWDEIALATLKPNSVAQCWASEENALKAIAQGAQILMSPAKKAYIDMQYDKSTPLGLHWAAYIEVDDNYNWDPATYIPGVAKENIIGVEAPMWAETISRLDDIEYLMFPRLPGIAEIGWTPAELRNWDEYKLRLALHGSFFEEMDINYYKSPRVPWQEPK
ncbi:MAG: beta-N-acetylhexosaminidase [Bacteroidales bacterium]|jgi:hexosaminidase|nr:beta-N-acetylhexosaminidase [Bacteroidales bacterium]